MVSSEAPPLGRAPLVRDRAPKISKLHAMIDWVNTKPDYLLKPIAKLPLDISQLNTNSWFAGPSASGSVGPDPPDRRARGLQKVMLASKLE